MDKNREILQIVDFHTHVFPDLFGKIDPFSPQRVRQARRKLRVWLRPVSNTIHGVQTLFRYLPDLARKNLDQLGSIFPVPSLFVESILSDLIEAMNEASINFAVIIAQPPYISNEFILDLALRESRLIPVVNISKRSLKPGKLLRNYVERGAKALKIHPAFDGEDVNSSRYRTLLRAANELNLPVILHTGCILSRILYRSPIQANAENFVRWYKDYPKLKFILAHMNFHQPSVALDICEEFPNVFVDTSWQPAEIIGEAVRRIGPDRVLLGSDWPFVGNNMLVARKRVQDCLETGLLNEQQAKLILGENALKLLGLELHAS